MYRQHWGVLQTDFKTKQTEKSSILPVGDADEEAGGKKPSWRENTNTPENIPTLLYFYSHSTRTRTPVEQMAGQVAVGKVILLLHTLSPKIHARSESRLRVYSSFGKSWFAGRFAMASRNLALCYIVLHLLTALRMFYSFFNTNALTKIRKTLRKYGHWYVGVKRILKTLYAVFYMIINWQ